MIPRRRHDIAALLIAGGIASGVAVLPAFAEDPTAGPVVSTASERGVDAKTALQTAIALGYTEFRRAGLHGDTYEIEAVDGDGKTVVLSLDPETGGLVSIRKDM